MNTSALASPDLNSAPITSAARPRRALAERLRKPATWLAIAALAPLWLSLPEIHSPRLRELALAAGLVAVVAAMLGRLWCALYIAGRKNAELCQDGPYSLVRNPLYVFSFIGATGVALASARLGLVPAIATVFVLYYHFVVKSEERRLSELFPQSYPAYRAEVPRSLPRLHGYRTRETITLDPRSVTRAMREVVWFPVAFVAAALLARLG